MTNTCYQLPLVNHVTHTVQTLCIALCLDISKNQSVWNGTYIPLVSGSWAQQMSKANRMEKNYHNNEISWRVQTSKVRKWIVPLGPTERNVPISLSLAIGFWGEAITKTEIPPYWSIWLRSSDFQKLQNTMSTQYEIKNPGKSFERRISWLKRSKIKRKNIQKCYLFRACKTDRCIFD